MKHSGVMSFFMTTPMYEIDAFKPNTWNNSYCFKIIPQNRQRMTLMTF